MNEITNKDIFSIIHKKTEEDVSPASGYEAYSMLLERTDACSAAERGLDKLLKSYWNALKEKNESAAMAYAGELARQATLCADAYIRLAVVSRQSEDISF